MNGGAIIAQILKEHDVRYLFTVCGGHISPILTESNKAGIRIIDVRHEATAVFAADAVSRLTGIPGVAAVTAGPGVANSVTALVNASMAQSPLVVFGGAAATVLKGRGSLQDIDQVSLVRSAVKAVFTIKRNCDFIPVIEFAFAFAQSGVPGPVFIECPIDLLYDEELVRLWYKTKSSAGKADSFRKKVISWYLKRHLDRMYACDLDSMAHDTIASVKPDMRRRTVVKALQLIDKSARSLLIVGSQAALNPGRASQLAESIRMMNIPVYLTGMARGLLEGHDPLQLHHKRNAALAEADCVILAGMPCDFRLDYGLSINKEAATIAINRSRHDLTLNHKPDLAVHADPAEFLTACSSLIKRSGSRDDWMRVLQGREQEREEEIKILAGQKTEYVNPLLLLEKIDGAVSDAGVIVADGGDFISTASYIVRPRSPLSWLDPGVFGTLGVGAGFALGAKLCRPEADVWLLWGDGAAGYSIIEFDTFVRHKLPVIAVIGNDAGWTQIGRDQVVYLKDDVATVLRYANYHGIADSFGARGFLIAGEDQIDATIRQALDLSRKGTPVLLNALIGKTDFRKGSISM
ncbi:MAG: acetolactate synthase [Spirochaetes bacterium RBG_16_49_21]|nr:MAG: acetolactate synthase [Spirochaetes bacterium RBG_16_49_21]